MQTIFYLLIVIFLPATSLGMTSPKAMPIASENLLPLLFQALSAHNCIYAAKLIHQLNPDIHPINARDLNDNTMVHLLARQNQSENLAVRLLQILYNKGAKIDLRNINDDTPLLYAINSANLRFAYWLMVYEADHLWSNKQSATGLHLLCRNENLIRRLNECLHRCNQKRTEAAVLGCKKGILSNFWLLSTSRQCKSFIPSLYALCLKLIGSWKTEDLQKKVPKLKEMLINQDSIIIKNTNGKILKPLIPFKVVQRSAPMITVDLTATHIRSPLPENSKPMPLVELLSTDCLETLYKEVVSEASIRSLPINWTDTNGFTALAHLAKSGACFEIMEYMIALGASRMERDADGNLPYKLFKFVRCCCDDRVSRPRVEELLTRPERIANEIARLAQQRKLAENKLALEATSAPSATTLTPRAELKGPSPRV